MLLRHELTSFVQKGCIRRTIGEKSSCSPSALDMKREIMMHTGYESQLSLSASNTWEVIPDEPVADSASVTLFCDFVRTHDF